MSIPISVQLYSVRAELEKDFEGVIRKIAAMGYAGVETHRFPGTAADAAKLFSSLNLKVSSAHQPLPLGDKKNEVIETMQALGSEYLVCAHLPPDQYYSSLDAIKKACDLLNESNAVARQHGLTFVYHNHWFEYEPVEGKIPADILVEKLDPTIVFELDTYWAQVAGADPVAIIKKQGARIPLLHIKDGPVNRPDPMVAVGSGKMDVPAIVEAGKDSTKWLIVELDRCATDMLEAVDKSYQYLVQAKLGYGNKS